MSIKVQKKGSSFFITGYTYPIKEKLKAKGCTWDKINRCWVTDDIEVARDLRDNPPQETVELDAPVVIGKAEYKGRIYPVLWKKDQGRKLAFTDGTAVFWAKEGATDLEAYSPPISLEDFQE